MDNLVGQRFGHLTVVSMLADGPRGKRIAKCACDCGRTLSVSVYNLRNGQRACRSCGSRPGGIATANKNKKEIVGLVVGKLVVIARAEDVMSGGKARSAWICRCACGKEVIVLQQSLLKKNPTKSCGCITIERSTSLSGDKHPCWKGDEVDRTREYGPDERAWSCRVFRRDGYRCQKCGATGNNLHAHHIVSWSAAPALRYDIENGITLCEGCHLGFGERPNLSAFHRVYGTKGFTEDDFWGWINAR